MRLEESYLSERPLHAFVLLEALNWAFFMLERNIKTILDTGFFASFLIRFILRATVLLLIAPKVLKIPNGQRTFKQYIEDIKLRQKKPVWRSLKIATYLAVILLGALFIAATLYGGFQWDLSQLDPSKSPILLVAINAGLWEEIMWRGIIMTLFLKRYSARSAVLINTGLFAISHLINLLSGQSIIVMLGQIVFVLIGTPILAYLFIMTESLLPVILLHFAVDAFSPLFINSMIQPGPDIIKGGIYMLLGWMIGNIVANIVLQWHSGRIKTQPD